MSQSASLPFVRRPPRPRPLPDKLQELALRAPKDLQAIERLVDLVLTRLDEAQRLQRPSK